MVFRAFDCWADENSFYKRALSKGQGASILKESVAVLGPIRIMTFVMVQARLQAWSGMHDGDT